MVKQKTPGGKDYTAIQTIMHDDPSPLHADLKIKEEWLKDELTWNDVYVKKPLEYLEAISRGETPRWDSNANKYVYGDSSETEILIGGNQSYEDPQINLGPFAGVIADKFDRRKLMIVCDVLRFSLYLSIPIVGNYFWLYTASILVVS